MKTNEPNVSIPSTETVIKEEGKNKFLLWVKKNKGKLIISCVVIAILIVGILGI
jgi:hypothetical protein